MDLRQIHPFIQIDSRTQPGRIRRAGSLAVAAALLVMLGMAADRRAAAATVEAGLALDSIAFGGDGRIVLLDGETTPARFADPGRRPADEGTWRPGAPEATVAYVRRSVPRLSVALRINGTLPAGTPVELIGRAADDEARALTTAAVARADGVPGEVLRFELDARDPLADGVARIELDLDWRARVGVDGGDERPVGRSRARVLVIYGAPTGAGLGPDGGVSRRRIEHLVDLADGRDTPFDIVAALGPALTARGLYDLRRGLQDAALSGEPFAVLDGIRADCRTLALLMERGLGLLGVPGARVLYVFPRTGSWRGLSTADPEGHTQRAEIRMNLLGATQLAALYFENADGPNRFHACCVWSGTDPATGATVAQWWMGGNGHHVATDYDVLMTMTRPNRLGAPRQLYVDDLADGRDALHEGPIPYPNLPRVWGSTEAAAREAIRAAGYDHVVVVRRRTWLPGMAGRARRCYAPGTAPGLPASPHARVILEIYQS